MHDLRDNCQTDSDTDGWSGERRSETKQYQPDYECRAANALDNTGDRFNHFGIIADFHLPCLLALLSHAHPAQRTHHFFGTLGYGSCVRRRYVLGDIILG